MKISNISLYFQKEKIFLKRHVLNKIAYAVKLCIVLILCAKKLLLKSEHFHPKSNCFQAPQTGISSTVCCKSDFTVISLYSSLDFPFQFKTLPPPLFQNPHQIAVRFVHYFSAEQCATCTALGL